MADVYNLDLNCDTWTAVSNVPWITITSPASGGGSGFAQVGFVVDANTGVQRQGTMTIAGQTVMVTQAGGSCQFGLASASANATSDGGSAFFALNASSPFCFWTAVPSQSQSWLTITSANTGSGNSTLGYSVAANTGSSARSATISVGGQTFTVNQGPAGVPITVTTSPAGLLVSIDGGTAQASPVTMNLSQGTHSISVNTPQAGPTGTQYVFTGWSDSGAATHNITVGASSATYTASFKTQYQLTASASPASGGTVSPASGFFDSGSTVNLTATANGGYAFVNWTGAVADPSNPSTTVTMGSLETVTANFTSSTAITIQTSPAGLQFTIDGGAPQNAPATVNLQPGPHTIALAATQAGTTGTQYVFTSWSDSGAVSHSITVGAAAATFTATFKTQYQLTLSASPAAGGTVTPLSGGFYDTGSTVNIGAAANSGYQFSSWSGNVANGNAASTSVTMTSPQSIIANFSSLTGITIQTNPPGLQFTVDGGAVQTAPQTLSLLPGQHTLAVAGTQAGATGTQYVFLSWSDAGAPSHTITVGTSAATYTATFETQYQLTLAASPLAGGTVSPATGTFYNSGAAVNVLATANSGYQFVNWTGPVANTSSASTSVTMNAAATVTANFSSSTGITIATSPAGLQFSVDGGTAMTAPQVLSLSQGPHTIAVAATQTGQPGMQYVFTSWSDSGAVSHSITVTGSPATYTASFKTQYQLMISASPAVGGVVTPLSGTYYDAASTVPITATASAGFVFTGWTGAVASASGASTTVSMTAAEVVTANFATGQAPPAVMVFSPAQAATSVAVTASLTWTGVAGATSYDVYFGASATPPLAQANLTGTSYLPTMSAGVTYYWMVTAKNAFGATPSAV